MRRLRIFLTDLTLVFVVMITSIQVCAEKAESQNPALPQMREGEMFTVKLVPRGKKMEFFVTGNPFAKLQLSEAGLTAALRVGQKVWVMSPKKEGGVYRFDQNIGNTNPTELNLELKALDKSEQFDFQLKP